MSINNKHINYSAEDLLRYARGKMNAKEMHALEKSSLEDPFLAEALMGYMEMASKGELSEKLNLFKKNIIAKSSSKIKVVSLWQRPFFKYAAASVVLISAWWIYSSTNPSHEEKEQNLAQNVQNNPNTNETIVENNIKPTDNNTHTNDATNTVNDKKNNKETNSLPSNNVLSANKSEPIAPGATSEKNDNISSGFGSVSNNLKPNRTNYNFNGKIVDENGNPIPYAGITIRYEDEGYYSDAKGNFKIAYPDSIIEITTNSIGYEPKSTIIAATQNLEKVVLQEDADKRSRFSKAKKSTDKSLIELNSSSSAEPSINIDSYNLYLANNKRINASGSTVELCFFVDPNGNIKNLSIEKSAGREMDKEAIRLIKQGPKWKIKNDQGKVQVKINF